MIDFSIYNLSPRYLKNIYSANANIPSDSNKLANANKKLMVYTNREKKEALKVIDIIKSLGFPSKQNLINLIRNGSFINKCFYSKCFKMLLFFVTFMRSN